MWNKIRRVLGIILIVSSLICFYFAYQQYMKYQRGNEEYEDLEAMVVTEEEPESEEEEPPFRIDWDSLIAQNPEFVGWIRMDPTVSYPIVKGGDNKFYLKHGFNGKYNINGCVFMHCDNSPDWSDKNTLVYGHNMNNGSMFGNNDYYNDKAYALEHPYFYIYVKDGFYTYRIFDVMTVSDGSAPYTIGIENEADFADYLAKMKKLSSYDLGVNVTEKDQIVTLSTCAVHGKKRLVIQGVLDSYETYDGVRVTVAEIREKQAAAEAAKAATAAETAGNKQETSAEQAAPDEANK